jgi:xylulokinase
VGAPVPSSDSLLLGLDIGTLGVKGVIVRRDGRVLARGRREHSISHPQPGRAEHDPERDWWEDGVAVIRALLAAAGADPRHIAAAGVCGLTPCLALTAADGRAVRAAILYNDNRALDQLAALNAGLGLSLTGQAITPKWRWLAEHEPDALARARVILSSHGYFIRRLTGQPALDYDTASIMGGIFDVARKTWDTAACERMGLEPRLLPPLYPATGFVGEVTAEAAALTGLAEGTRVIAGTGDTFPTLVGCGAVDPGDAMISFGTTGLLTLTVKPLASAAAGPHFTDAGERVPAGGAVLWAANVLACGELLAWYREAFGRAVVPRGVELPDFATLDAAAAGIAPGAGGLVVLPHLLGRRSPEPAPHARGVIFGLAPEHTAAHVYRGLLEAFAYAVRQGLEPVRGQVRRVAATAGGAASPLWRQIMADVLELPLEYHPQAAGSLGIAFLAGYAAGLLPDFAALKDQWLVDNEIVAPNAEAATVYRRAYATYLALEEALAPVFASAGHE